VVLQNGAKSLWIAAQAHNPMAIGDLADATGFPDVHDGFLTLTGGEIQDLQVLAPVQPVAANWRQLASSVHIFDLVSIEGKVVMEAREASQDEYVLVSGGNLFSAIYRHPPSIAPVPIPLPPMKEVPLGSRVRVTGICALESAVPFDRDVPFSILLRTSNDVAVVARPSLLTIRNLILIVGVLLCVVIAAGAWGWTLKSKVHGQTVALATRIEAEAASERRNAQLEQWRSRILEDINGSRPLAEVIEEITALVSFRLDAAPCWCEIADGARLGGYPTDADILRRVSEPIPARAGPPLGALLAGFDPDSQPGSNESEALIVGARLATLAIETRKLYSDLLHRSEFDLLTDIHNRFSLDSHLEARIAQAREKASIFGLIYVDLDDFKQVNDRYGHRIGDLFLQEAAVRMKRQLRSVDTLARVGGDEFAVLVPEVRNRAKVEEIALRLERCFEEPFAMEGVVLRGSASVGIALYPEDGTSRDSMLSAADAAMYLAKHRHQQIA
jgi:diguanylate cyclase (GGDEF)-like protein